MSHRAELTLVPHKGAFFFCFHSSNFATLNKSGNLLRLSRETAKEQKSDRVKPVGEALESTCLWSQEET